MLEGGDDPLYVARRLIRMASEDIGLANPSLLGMAVSAYQATQLIGMPECDVSSSSRFNPPLLDRTLLKPLEQCILAGVVVALAESPKSIRTYAAYKRAKTLVRDTENFPVPLHIRNAPTGLMKQLGYGRDYRYVLAVSSAKEISRWVDPDNARLHSYNPQYCHPVFQPFLPPELLANPATRFLQDDESVEGKTVDEAALREWEEQTLGGARWQGRDEMERKLEALESKASSS